MNVKVNSDKQAPIALSTSSFIYAHNLPSSSKLFARHHLYLRVNEWKLRGSVSLRTVFERQANSRIFEATVQSPRPSIHIHVSRGVDDDDDNLHEESISDLDQADEHADDVQERVGDDEVVEAAAQDEEEEATQRAESKRSVAYNREERLRQDLFVLRKLNTAFSGYNEALGDVHSGTEVSSHLASGTLARCYPSYDVSLSAFQNSSRRQTRY